MLCGKCARNDTCSEPENLHGDESVYICESDVCNYAAAILVYCSVMPSHLVIQHSIYNTIIPPLCTKHYQYALTH